MNFFTHVLDPTGPRMIPSLLPNALLLLQTLFQLETLTGSLDICVSHFSIFMQF